MKTTFYKNSTRRDSLQAECKPCRKHYYKESVHKN